jgi:ergothioneine biosynthesis protein EgtB
METVQSDVGRSLQSPALYPDSTEDTIGLYQYVRRFSQYLAEPLKTEDYCIQSAEMVSPTKWHLAHTSWFFETFILGEYRNGYRSLHPQYAFLYNSYYNQAGPMHSRPRRGLISRPTVEETFEYRRYVDEHMIRLISGAAGDDLQAIARLVTLGCNHEQQHQELMLTDIKHVFAQNPLHPVYRPAAERGSGSVPPLQWISVDEGIYEIGHAGGGFAYDNENPRHRVFLEPFKLASRLITNGEYLEFINDGGYRRPELWLSAGWDTVQLQGWKAPLYWMENDGSWSITTLGGLRPLDPDEPVCHVSYFEADAFARWAGARLPFESEWEVAADGVPVEGNFAERGVFHPAPLRGSDGKPGAQQMYGDVWEWTHSHYSPYPGYSAPPGAIGEYNGKFMCNQFVLRGGSCATSESHIRRTYRNFFQPEAQWQFSGIRLAASI